MRYNGGRVRIFTLTVAWDHTFFVGCAGVQVHDTGSPILTDFNGTSLLQRIRAEGVRIVQDDEPQIAYLRRHGGKGITRFWGTDPADTEVILLPEASNATIAEEYLHVQCGKARGWIGLMPPESYLEEVLVAREVLAHAAELTISAEEQAELQGTLRHYISLLDSKYDIRV